MTTNFSEDLIRKAHNHELRDWTADLRLSALMKEFKGRQERAECYEARDSYFACCEKQPDGTDCKSACKDLYDKFEKSCGAKWTEHFLRKHEYLKFKERLQTEGITALDSTKYKDAV